MTEDQKGRKVCFLNLNVREYGGITNQYYQNSGLHQSLVLQCRIDDPYVRPLGDIDESAPNSAFHHKSARLEIYSPPDIKWLGKVSKMTSVDSAIGGAWIKAGVEPNGFELDEERVEIEPVLIKAHLSSNAFNAIRSQIAEACNLGRVLGVKLTLLVGALLPGHGYYECDAIVLRDLDVSQDTVFAIGELEVFDTRFTKNSQKRVSNRFHGRATHPSFALSILLTSTSYNFHTEYGLFYRIECDGRIIRGGGGNFKKNTVSINFNEFEPNNYGELPDKSFFGRFYYSPDSAYIQIELWYLPDDARKLLIPLLGKISDAQITLDVTLMHKEEELTSATDEFQGNVLDYSFHVENRLTDK